MAVAAGLGLCVLLLEIGLRVAGALFLWQQEQANRETLESRGEYVVMCVGESTTAMGGPEAYPAQLEEVLNERGGGRRFTVLNKGIPGTDTSAIIAQLQQNLEAYEPNVVVAMMGANDFAGAIPHDGKTAVERTGFPYSLKVYKLAALLYHQVAGPATTPQKMTGKKGPPPDEKSKSSLDRDKIGRQSDLDADPLTAVYAGLGRHFEEEGRQEQAEAMFLEVVKRHPSMQAWLDLALHYERLEEHDKSAPAFSAAVAADPDNGFAHFALGRTYRKLDRFEEAAREFEVAVRLNPYDANGHVSLGLCYEALEKFEEAERAFLEGLELAPQHNRVFIRLADFYERRGEHEKFEELIPLVLDKNGSHVVVGRMARYYHRTGNREKAAEYAALADRLRLTYWHEMTEQNYRHMLQVLREKGLKLVAVQYPTRSVEPLKRMLPDHEDVFFVDNEELFKTALEEYPYEEIFWDNCYGDFGHCTGLGNRMLAENVALEVLAALGIDGAARPAGAVPAEEMVRIPGGTFIMGAVVQDRRAKASEHPRHPVTISPFMLDKYEVTVAAWRKAVEAGEVLPPRCRVENPWELAMCNWRFAEREAHPVNGVSWLDAQAYCRSRGKRLPTEAEFEYVHRDGIEGTTFPWPKGKYASRGTGNFAGREFPSYLAEGPIHGGHIDDHVLTAPVGSFPANSFGVHDMAGNIWEWCNDWFGEEYYAVPPAQDPTGPETGRRRTMRGGNFHCIIEELRLSERHHKMPDDPSVYTGFRCARDL